MSAAARRRAGRLGAQVAQLAATCAIAGCNPAYVADRAGPADPNSVTVFTLALQPQSVTGCIMADSSMTRPMTLTVKNDAATLLTDGGIHYGLTRTAPGIYEGGYWAKIRADVATRPRTLTVRNDDSSCVWSASTP